MRFGLRDAIFVVIGLAAFPCAPDAQDVGYFAGAIAGVATLSGDPSFIVTTVGFAVSGYKLWRTVRVFMALTSASM